MIPYPPVESLTWWMVLYAVILAVVGTLIALFTGICMRGIERVMDKTFGDRVIQRVMAAGVIIAVVGYFLPALLFSGEMQIHLILENPAAIGAAMLFLYAVLKILLFALSFKSGYIGGPIFPILFSCTMMGLSLSLLFRRCCRHLCALHRAAAFALAMGAPLTAIILVLVVSNPGSAMMVLVVISATTALVIGALLPQLRARWTRKQVTPLAEPTLTE